MTDKLENNYEHQGLDYTSYIVEQVQYIEQQALTKDADKRAAYVSNAGNRLAKKEIDRLGYTPDKDTGLVDETKTRCAGNTYVNIMNRYRNAIKALNYKHHSLEHSLSQLIAKFNHVYPDLSALPNITQKTDLKRYLRPGQKIDSLRDKLVLLRSAIPRKTEFGKRLFTIKIEHHTWYLFAPIESVVSEKRATSDKNLNIKHKNQVLINGDWIIEQATDLIEQGIEELGAWLKLKRVKPGLEDYDKTKYRSKRIPYPRLAIGLAMASGRRSTEIMRTANFLPGTNDNFVLFSGQLKTKNRRLFEDLKPYEIPVIVDRDLFLKGFEVLRAFSRTEHVSYVNNSGERVTEKLLSGPIDNTLKNDAVHTKYTKTLNTRISLVLGSGEFTLKDSRAIAAQVAFNRFNPNRLTAKLFLGDYLGHAKAKNTSYEYYDGYILDDEVEQIEFVTGSKTGSEKQTASGENAVKDSEFLTYLLARQGPIEQHLRAPKWADMNKWLIERVKAGLSRLDIMVGVDAVNEKGTRKTSGTAALRSIFRKDCIIDNKGVSPKSVETYLADEKGLALNSDLTWEKSNDS
jgi:hypothetical protein